MKKALQISISKTLFTVEEDAYNKLESYLTEVKVHFKNINGYEEIIADIENRIAEQLLESKEKVITISTVEKVLDLMGSVEDFDDNTTETETTNANTENKPTQNKKFYRNPDDMLIAGVCSGLGTYFGIDTLLVRLGFIFLTFLSGFGIFLYVVLWILVPEAKTKSQRLEMIGSPVTIETLSGAVNEQIEKIKNNKENWKNNLRSIINFPFKIVGKIIRGFLKIIGPTLRVLISLFLILVSLFVFAGVTIGSGFFISPGIWISNDIPMQALLPGNLQMIAMTGIALAIIIPTFFVLIGGLSLIKKKNLISNSFGFSLLGLWFISLIVSGFSIAQIVTNYKEIENNSPNYQSITSFIPIETSFENLKIDNGISLILFQDATTTLEATGAVKEIDSINTRVEDNTLIIENKPIKNSDHFCIFCSTKKVKLVLTVPALSNITIDNGSNLEISKRNDCFTTKSLELNMKSGSYANMALKVRNLKVQMTDNSELGLKGEADTAEINTDYGSSLAGKDFKTTTAKIIASNGSTVKIQASKTLDAIAKYGSQIFYLGDPEVTQKATGDSQIESIEIAN